MPIKRVRNVSLYLGIVIVAFSLTLAFAGPSLAPRNPLEAPKSLTGKTAELKKPELKKIEAPKAEIKKPEIKKVEIKRMNTMQPPSPPKKAKADEWDF